MAEQNSSSNSKPLFYSQLNKIPKGLNKAQIPKPQFKIHWKKRSASKIGQNNWASKIDKDSHMQNTVHVHICRDVAIDQS